MGNATLRPVSCSSETRQPAWSGAASELGVRSPHWPLARPAENDFGLTQLGILGAAQGACCRGSAARGACRRESAAGDACCHESAA